MTGLSLLPTCVCGSAAGRSQEVAADDCDILEDTPPEREQRDEIQVDAEAITEECESRREKEVRVEARDEDTCVEVSFELRAIRTEERIERRKDADSGVSRPLDGQVEAQREAEQHPCDKAEERKKDLTVPFDSGDSAPRH
jgi:hypothetical protein